MSEFAYDVVIGLGANLGEPLQTFAAAVEVLKHPLANLRCSRLYRSGPLGPEQPDFLNAALRGRYCNSARELLAACQQLEARLGRVRAERWGPRVVDLDVLWIDGVQLTEPDLIVPHPRLHERAFALRPLLDLAPDARDPATGRLYSSFLPAVAEQRIEVVYPAVEWCRIASSLGDEPPLGAGLGRG